jgi:uncharacterized membrane protein YkvA (DUF1232 family)
MPPQEKGPFQPLPPEPLPPRGGFARWYSDGAFWRKVGGLAGQAGRKLLLTALTLFHCLQDRATPAWAKGVILGALGYLILPADALPDVLPVVGLTDDWAAIAAALATVAAYVRDEHKAKAREQVARLLGKGGPAPPGA